MKNLYGNVLSISSDGGKIKWLKGGLQEIKLGFSSLFSIFDNFYKFSTTFLKFIKYGKKLTSLGTRSVTKN